MVEVSKFANRLIVGLKANFISASEPNSNAAEVIGPLWAKASSMFFELGVAGSEKAVGIGAMWPVKGGQPGEMVYFAGYEVAKVPDSLGELETLKISAGEYAHTTFVGKMSDLPGAVVAFYSEQLPKLKLQVRDGMDLEIYEEVGEVARVVIAAPVSRNSGDDADNIVLFSA